MGRSVGRKRTRFPVASPTGRPIAGHRLKSARNPRRSIAVSAGDRTEPFCRSRASATSRPDRPCSTGLKSLLHQGIREHRRHRRRPRRRGFQSLLHQGIREHAEAEGCGLRIVFQSLLHQGIREHGASSDQERLEGFNPFFIRAFASTLPRRTTTPTWVSIPSSSGHSRARSFKYKKTAPVRFQSLLHQGIREHQTSALSGRSERFQSLLHQGIREHANDLSKGGNYAFQSLLHQGIREHKAAFDAVKPAAVSIPSSSGHSRARIERTTPMAVLFQSLLHQGIREHTCCLH